jgi:hypothetical protein
MTDSRLTKLPTTNFIHWALMGAITAMSDLIAGNTHSLPTIRFLKTKPQVRSTWFTIRERFHAGSAKGVANPSGWNVDLAVQVGAAVSVTTTDEKAALSQIEFSFRFRNPPRRGVTRSFAGQVESHRTESGQRKWRPQSPETFP